MGPLLNHECNHQLSCLDLEDFCYKMDPCEIVYLFQFENTFVAQLHNYRYICRSIALRIVLDCSTRRKRYFLRFFVCDVIPIETIDQISLSRRASFATMILLTQIPKFFSSRGKFRKFRGWYGYRCNNSW